MFIIVLVTCTSKNLYLWGFDCKEVKMRISRTSGVDNFNFSARMKYPKVPTERLRDCVNGKCKLSDLAKEYNISFDNAYRQLMRIKTAQIESKKPVKTAVMPKYEKDILFDILLKHSKMSKEDIAKNFK